MVIFSWIVLGIAGLLLLGSTVCYGIHLAIDSYEWKRLGVKVFRVAMVFVLFYVNAVIYMHIFGVFVGTEKPVAEAVTDAVGE